MVERRGTDGRRLVAIVATLATLLVVAGVAFAVTKALHHTVNPADDVLPPASTVLGTGAKVPEAIILPRLGAGAAISLAAELHGRPGVVNFFASYCPACQRELSAFAKTSDAFGNKVAFVGIDTTDSRPQLALSLAIHAGVRYPLGIDTSNNDALTAYGATGLPDTFIVDRTGHLRWEIIGAATAVELKSHLAPLLGPGK